MILFIFAGNRRPEAAACWQPGPENPVFGAECGPPHLGAVTFSLAAHCELALFTATNLIESKLLGVANYGTEGFVISERWSEGRPPLAEQRMGLLASHSPVLL